jgi:hypothetical protein
MTGLRDVAFFNSFPRSSSRSLREDQMTKLGGVTPPHSARGVSRLLLERVRRPPYPRRLLCRPGRSRFAARSRSPGDSTARLSAGRAMIGCRELDEPHRSRRPGRTCRNGCYGRGRLRALPASSSEQAWARRFGFCCRHCRRVLANFRCTLVGVQRLGERKLAETDGIAERVHAAGANAANKNLRRSSTRRPATGSRSPSR